MGTTKQRKNHIEWIERILKQAFTGKPDEFIYKDVFLANFAYKNYTTERTGLAILKMLEKLGYIKIYGNEILQGEKWIK